MTAEKSFPWQMKLMMAFVSGVEWFLEPDVWGSPNVGSANFSTALCKRYVIRITNPAYE